MANKFTTVHIHVEVALKTGHSINPEKHIPSEATKAVPGTHGAVLAAPTNASDLVKYKKDAIDEPAKSLGGKGMSLNDGAPHKLAAAKKVDGDLFGPMADIDHASVSDDNGHMATIVTSGGKTIEKDVISKASHMYSDFGVAIKNDTTGGADLNIKVNIGSEPSLDAHFCPKPAFG